MMDLFVKIICAGLMGFMVYSMWRALKENPEALSRASVNQSMSLLLKLAVVLIVFLGLLVLLLKQG